MWLKCVIAKQNIYNVLWLPPALNKLYEVLQRRIYTSENTI